MSTTTFDFAEFAATAQKQWLASIKQAQEVSLRAAKIAVDSIPTVPAVPAPRTIVETSFAFAGEVLDLQRAYALELVDIAAKNAPKVAKTTTETTAK